MLRPAFPQLPAVVFRNAAGLNHCSRRRPPGGSSETPGILSGRVSPPALEKLVRAETVYGFPVLKAWMPSICQPSSRILDGPFKLRANGRSRSEERRVGKEGRWRTGR